MKVKNVLKGLKKEFELEEINIISDEKVIFSGSLDNWNATTNIYLLTYKKEVENMDVLKRMMFNRRKAFIFV